MPQQTAAGEIEVIKSAKGLKNGGSTIWLGILKDGRYVVSGRFEYYMITKYQRIAEANFTELTGVQKTTEVERKSVEILRCCRMSKLSDVYIINVRYGLDCYVTTMTSYGERPSRKQIVDKFFDQSKKSEWTKV